MISKTDKRLRRAAKTRVSIARNQKDKLCVFRSARHISAQVIRGGIVLASASTLDNDLALSGYTGNVNSAEAIGALVAQKAVKAGVTNVAFDRAGYKYHGRVKALADGARKAGLSF